jgi:DNA replication protein DnaC
MLNEQTHKKLMDMKMYGLAAEFERYLDEPGKDKLSFDERLGLMVDREWTERQERKLKLRLSKAKLREKACIEDIDYRHPRGLDRSIMQRLAACKWIAEHENVIITGPTGVGKTWIACALTDKACREGHSARYTRVPRLLHDLNIARADGTYSRELGRLARTDVLILDDWGLAPLGDRERRDILEIVEDRNGRRSTIVTSQLPVKKWHDNIGEPTIADSIMDRLVHNAHRIELKGASLRKTRTEKRKGK